MGSLSRNRRLHDGGTRDALESVRGAMAGCRAMSIPLHRLRAGIIWTGFIGPVHIEALKRLGVQVTAVCGSTEIGRAHV